MQAMVIACGRPLLTGNDKTYRMLKDLQNKKSKP